MKTNALTTCLASILLLPLVACSPSGHSGTDAAGGTAQAIKDVQQQTSPSVISAEIHKGMEKAKRELATKDIDIDRIHVGNGRDDDDRRDLPKAVITPGGDLVIAGKPVTATPAQHAMLLDYRQQIVGIAEAGIDIGEHGANLGTQAAREAILGALSGKTGDEIEARIKPQAEQIKTAAMKLCQRLPDLLASQQKLAAAMPQFRPYATMTQRDVEDCGKDVERD